MAASAKMAAASSLLHIPRGCCRQCNRHQARHMGHMQRSLTGSGQQANRRTPGHRLRRLLLLRGRAHDHLLPPGHLHLGRRLHARNRGRAISSHGALWPAAGRWRAAQSCKGRYSICSVAAALVSAAGRTAMREVCRASMVSPLAGPKRCGTEVASWREADQRGRNALRAAPSRFLAQDVVPRMGPLMRPTGALTARSAPGRVAQKPVLAIGGSRQESQSLETLDGGNARRGGFSQQPGNMRCSAMHPECSPGASGTVGADRRQRRRRRRQAAAAAAAGLGMLQQLR